ncbi:ParB N-terminal domain-containing protein [Paeniglutamicibacter sp.]|uniref:ParB N-terminal domain-containing protein n=1 Tax=Paeniglutamicibacter sp. TaxID=1934391 RepID=UPI003989FAB3
MRTIDQIATTAMVVPVSQLRENTLNSRETYEDIETLGAELKNLQVQALLVFPSTSVEGDYTVLDGHRRLRAARASDILTLRCEVMAEAPSRREQLRYIHSAGTTAKNLLQTELATLVQGSFDELGDDALVAQDLQRPVEYVRARRLLATSTPEVRAQVDAGQVDAMELLKLDEVAEEFEGTEFADELVQYVASGPNWNGHFDVDGAIAKARFKRDLPEALEAIYAELKDHKAKQAPEAARYGDWMTTNRSGTEAETAMSVAEHVAAGHVYYVYESSASVTWYWKRPKAEAAVVELSPEERAVKEAEEAAEAQARQDHAVGTDRREQWLKERFEAKDPMAPLQARVALVRVLMKSVSVYYNETGKAALAMLTGIPASTEDWNAAVESNLRKRSWSWLAAALEFASVHQDGLKMLRSFGPLHAGMHDTRLLEHLQAHYGYELFPEEQRVQEYHAAEAKKLCKDCEERRETDDAGRCPECAEAALVQHCEDCDQAMVAGPTAGDRCAECVEGED